MSDMTHLRTAIGQAAQFVQATWQQVVMGSQSVPGAKEITERIGLRRLYADNIILGSQLRNGGNLSQNVLATKDIAKQLESGTGPWDMKPMLLGGPKARMGKKGRYNIIPFRQGAPGGTKDSNFKAMPKDIYKQARELKASVKAGKGMKWGGRLTGTEGAHPPGQNPSTGYQHKNGKHEGMVRIEKTYGSATQSKYMTFRIVSDNSDPGSWIHPGYKAHHIAASVSSFCKPGVEAMLREAATADLVGAINLDMQVT